MPANKPCPILKVSRKQYCAALLWKKAGLSREGFEEVLALLPEGFIDQVHLEVDAARLITAAFGSCGVGQGDG